MKFVKLTCITAMALFTLLAIPVRLAAQNRKPKHHMYKIVDLGTFGGPISVFSSAPIAQVLNNSGVATGYAETSTPDPYKPNCLEKDCLVARAFRWHNNKLTDLGALPGENSSYPTWVNDRGVSVGGSENGLIDPATGFPEAHSVLWGRDGEIVDLGEPFGGTQSQANGINNLGQVVGAALNTTPDPFGATVSVTPFFYLFFPGTTQVHAFLWQNDVTQDLGTLGSGTDSVGAFVNRRGQIAGQSLINSTRNQVTDPCGKNLPTLDPFLWEKGTGMLDLGTLGGTCGFPQALNNPGQVVGQSDLKGDVLFHAFLWTKPGPMRDLGTLGGNLASANWINDAGEVVGWATTKKSNGWSHAALWRKNRKPLDLGTLGCIGSYAQGINSKSQIVGVLQQCNAAFLWEHGSMVDLNKLIPPSSGLTVNYVSFINDQGEIAGEATLTNGDNHAVLLIPQ